MQKKRFKNLERIVKKKVTKKPYHVVYYTVDSTPAMRKFNSIEDMETFFKEFKKRYPKEDKLSGTFLDFSITNISGEIKFL